MFTGIIEAFGTITQLEKEGENIHIRLKSNLTSELKIDQSVAHNGVCLTVVKIDDKNYTVTAIKETIEKTNLSTWQVGDKINLERAMQLGARLDGHIVQGHVDQVGTCTNVREGSITSTSRTLKSNFLVRLVAVAKNSGETKPTAKTPTESTIAKIIKPIVVGSLSNRRFMRENAEARMSKNVVNSRASIKYSLTTIY